MNGRSESIARLLGAVIPRPEPAEPEPPMATTTSFDGGARTTAEPPRTEEQIMLEHGQLVYELAMASRLHRSSGSFW
jgi:hypothetical protein